MLRPARGEGERSKPNNPNLKGKVKGPLFITAALLATYPICYAQVALAYQLQEQPYASGSSTNLQSLQQRTATQMLLQNQSRTSQGLLSTPDELPSLESYQSTLSAYKQQLELLTPKVSDPERLKPLQLRINSLEAHLANAILYRNTYAKDYATYLVANSAYQAAQQTTAQALSNLNAAKSNVTTAQARYSNAQQAEQQALSSLEAARSAAQSTNSQYQATVQNLEAAKQNTSSKYSALQSAQQNFNNTNETYNLKLSTFNEANSKLNQVNQYLLNLEDQLGTATEKLNTAQAIYDDPDTYIPDPDFTPPLIEVPHTTTVTYTIQVPHTTTTYQGGLTAKSYNRSGYNNAPPLPSTNETPIATTTVSNIDFNWGGGYILNSGRTEDVLVKFQGNINIPETGYYYFFISADDGDILEIDNQRIIDGWYDKGGGGPSSSAIYLTEGQHSFTSYFYENGGGAAMTLYYATPQTDYQVIPSSWFGTYTSTTTYTTETVTEEETTYTLEPDPDATATYIPNPDLFIPVTEAQAELDALVDAYNAEVPNQEAAEADYLSAEENLASAQSANDAARTNLQTAQSNYDAAVQEQSAAQSAKDAADQTLSSNNLSVQQLEAQYSEALANTSEAKTNLQAATFNETTMQTKYEESQAEQTSSQTAFISAESTAATTNENFTSSYESTKTASADVASLFETIQPDPPKPTPTPEPQPVVPIPIDKTPTPTPTPEPEPEPEPQPTGSTEIPANLSAENLTQIDFANVDATELTPEQADLLVQVALQTFETAEAGSPEYEAALDALFLAAQEDDIEVDPELAAVPVLGAAVQGLADAINFLGNAGADLSPKVREESQKIVVSALVVGQIAQVASTAAMSSASSSFRRK